MKEINKNNIELKLNSLVTNIKFSNNKIEAVEVNNQYYINADHFIIATGGVSYPSTGSRGDGLRFSKSLGHNIIKVKPSLVPIELKNTWIKFLTGLTLKNIEISLFNDSLKEYNSSK